MALEGTIQDFALPDIFQLIGIQRKTGILTLQNGEDSVTIKFHQGQVVGADTRTESSEERLGTLLVRTGRITDAQLSEALREQRRTLQRLGFILVRSRYLGEEELVDALRTQASQIIYRLFRWREGSYHFDSQDDVDFDQKHVTPISSETILMEGARMIDEWPLIERRIRSPRTVFRRTPPTALDAGDALDVDRQAGRMPRAPSAEEQQILDLIDGRRTVEELGDLSTLGEFDTYRIVADLLARGLIEEARQLARAAGLAPARSRLDQTVGAVLLGLVGLAVLASLLTLSATPLAPWRIGEAGGGERLRRHASLARLERIESAVQVFYLDAGSFPRTLTVLTQNGYLTPADLQDPWGRSYHYELSPGGYRLVGRDGAGEPAPGLSISRSFSASQRMMLAGRPETAP